MNLEKIDAAIAEAQRFIDRANACKAAKQSYMDNYKGDPRWKPENLDHVHQPREQGALRRASMDLTRALADLRRPN
jgi:hypothetical protein